MKNHQFQRTANDFEIRKSRIDLFVWRRCICIYVCIYMWLLEIPVYKEGSIEIPLTVYKEGSIEIPLTGLTLPRFYAGPKPGPGFPTSYVVVFFVYMFNELRWEVIVWFVDISEIVNHHCLNIPFIKFGIKKKIH